MNPWLRERAPAYAAAFFLLLCLLLGGASAAGAIANGLLQLLAVPLIVASLWRLRTAPFPREATGLLWIVGLWLLLGTIQLVPLPPALWQALPAREAIAHGYELLGIPAPSLPVSLAPHASIASLLSLLPPVAMFLLVLQLQPRQRRRLAWVVLAVAVASIAWGAFQLFGGPQSPLRFYEITNRGVPVGFFANTNHLATLVLCALPFTGFLAARAAKAGGGRAGRSSGMIVSLAVAAFLSVGIGVIGSLAGYGLFLPAALASLLIYKRAVAGRLPVQWLGALGAVFLVFLGVAFAGPLNEQALSSKLDDRPASRKVIAATTLDAAADSFPVGSGLATFPHVYRTYQDQDAASHEFANHAHNDYLEVALELGLPGMLLMLAFLLWWARRTMKLWTDDFEGAALARAATVVIGLALLHSLADYPLRTAAIAALFAAACAMLVPPAARPDRPRVQPEDGEDKPLRHLEAV
jgi:O-antigen ligase